MPVRGLTIILGEDAPERLRTALGLALANVALGGRARIFLTGRGVAVLRGPVVGPDDAAHVAVGLPALSGLYDDAIAAGIRFILCQSGLHLTGTNPTDHGRSVTYGGPIGLLADMGDDRVLIA